MWYCANRHLHMAYAESADGFRWTRPELGLFDFDAAKMLPEAKSDFRGKKNNLFGVFGNGFTLMQDPNEKDGSPHRYKAVYGAVGIRDWTAYADGKAVIGAPSDQPREP